MEKSLLKCQRELTKIQIGDFLVFDPQTHCGYIARNGETFSFINTPDDNKQYMDDVANRKQFDELCRAIVIAFGLKIEKNDGVLCMKNLFVHKVVGSLPAPNH